MISFTVHGIPAPQGSKTAFVNKHTRRAQMVDTSSRLKPWRASVTAVAAEAMNGTELYTGPVLLQVEFVFPRPKSHYGTGKNAYAMKQSAPRYVTSKQNGDIDKLVRSVCDSLTGVVLGDDSQVVDVRATKVYGGTARATITVTPL